MIETYDFAAIEAKWQRAWEAEQAFAAVVDPARPKFYLLEMYPYPSGRIHMGHVRNYSIGDVIARQKIMAGYAVLHPIGWDALGMPAENAAIKHGTHPRTWTLDNVDHMRAQLKRMGISYDWSREVNTCLPEYYRWNQWIFLRMLERGLAFRKESWVNWCSQCRTVLANEQVVGGGCWRCETPVSQKKMEQWFLKITDYADELLSGHAALGKWPAHVLEMQKNWIGRSEGAHVRFGLDGDVEDDRGLHDPPRHDLRGDLPRRLGRASHRPRPRRRPEGEGARRVGLPDRRRDAPAPGHRRDREGRRGHRQEGGQSLHRRARPDLDRQLRPDGLRHGRDHGRSGPRRPRLRVRPDLRHPHPHRHRPAREGRRALRRRARRGLRGARSSWSTRARSPA